MDKVDLLAYYAFYDFLFVCLPFYDLKWIEILH